jgi:hypothetical protein
LIVELHGLHGGLRSFPLQLRSSFFMAYNILLMGASYGSLLASKILFGGHTIHLVCLPAEADLINAEGFRVRLPIRGRKDPVVLDSRQLPGKVTAGPASGVNPKDFDLVGLCMQEPQYSSAGVRDLLDLVARSHVPCMSIMNMPPLPYIRRIPGLDHDALKPAYTEPAVWQNFDPKCMTLNSPDPQAIRPPDEKVNVLMVTLPTNFKVARFEDGKASAAAGKGYRRRACRHAGGQDRVARQAEGSRFDFCAAREMGNAAGGKLPLHYQGRNPHRAGSGPQRPGDLPFGLQLRQRAVRDPGSPARRPGAV